MDVHIPSSRYMYTCVGMETGYDVMLLEINFPA